MDTRLSFFVTIQLSLLLFCLASSPPTFCHEKERSALLEFKKHFFHSTYSCIEHNVNKKIESWKLEAESGNCCAWDGIECDMNNGHVVGVELGFSCLSGSINSNTTLFHLAHLQRLDLSSNYLKGQVPHEMLKLNHLQSLDLSYNSGLKLRKPNLLDFMKSFTELESLNLTWVDISAPIPDPLANSSSLRSLGLDGCNLQGEVRPTIFEMPKLEFLDVSHNDQLSGHLPEFHSRSSLKSLSIRYTNLSGQLPSSLGQLSNLSLLYLSSNKFTGEIPSSLADLTQLIMLDLHSNHFSGHIPPQLTRLTRLSYVDLSFNNFSGSIPILNAKLKDLQHLNLESNNLNGTIGIGMFSVLKNLRTLIVSFNKLSFVENFNKTYSSPPKFVVLGLASCNLNSFPTFLQHQDLLESLDLSSNNISGEIPEWFLEMSKDSMATLNLSSNSLTSSLGSPLNFRWKNLETIDLRDNSLKGSVPIPSASVTSYLASRNELSGNLPLQICELGAIEGLDLSENNLTGALPRCLNNLSDTLFFLSLHDNNFIGEISQILGNGYCSLQMIDLSSNQFHGSLPRSLTRCHELEFLNLGDNHIKDVFPFWLGSLKYLRVLILHSNKFDGAVGEPETIDDFPSLQIVDLSSNNFQSCLPSMYFECWQAMKSPSSYKEGYMQQALLPYTYNQEADGVIFDYSLTIFVKGLKISYPKIQNYITFIDLSSNNFSCGIPSTIESLVQVQYLNLSNNSLTGPVPSFLKALTQLESLDLSQNKLYGKIPQELTQLTFLAKFNTSYNNLSGKIPEGRQFDTFTNDSYFGNINLCGSPLSKKCGKIEVSPRPQLQPEGRREESIEVDWRVVLMGYGSGLIISVVIGQRFTAKPARWMIKCFVRRARR